MSEESKKLANGARQQWDTVDKLMRVSRGSVDAETRRKVHQDAQAARRAVADQCSTAPENTERLEDLSTTIDSVIEESSPAPVRGSSAA